ncbi:helix-turn-helix domain-containing protein [Microlunatus sp. GCM10028923]|uniref:helix-turn-helix domain-containing protein n=1 Tax=Microlunatus sp. GCM10028923 TaxID=3273400 RepID=UPI0036211226
MSSSTESASASGNQSLARGLQMLRLLAENGPLTATELASRLGIHQSSASRSLAVLISTGYVRKGAQGRFECSFGVLGLADALAWQPFLAQLETAVRASIRNNDYPDITITFSMLWEHDVLHLLRSRWGRVHSLWNGGYPLNVSAPGLRLLLELPEESALAILDRSRDRLGWGGRPEVVPETAAGTLALARELLVDEVLLLDGWLRPQHATGAIMVRTPEPSPVALAIVDEAGHLGATAHTLLLHRVRRDLEAELN